MSIELKYHLKRIDLLNIRISFVIFRLQKLSNLFVIFIFNEIWDNNVTSIQKNPYS